MNFYGKTKIQESSNPLRLNACGNPLERHGNHIFSFESRHSDQKSAVFLRKQHFFFSFKNIIEDEPQFRVKVQFHYFYFMTLPPRALLGAAVF